MPVLLEFADGRLTTCVERSETRKDFVEGRIDLLLDEQMGLKEQQRHVLDRL
jgi:hypothetical protein